MSGEVCFSEEQQALLSMVMMDEEEDCIPSVPPPSAPIKEIQTIYFTADTPDLTHELLEGTIKDFRVETPIQQTDLTDVHEHPISYDIYLTNTAYKCIHASGYTTAFFNTITTKKRGLSTTDADSVKMARIEGKDTTERTQIPRSKHSVPSELNLIYAALCFPIS